MEVAEDNLYQQTSFLNDQTAAVELSIPLPTSRHGWMRMSRDVHAYIVNALKEKSVEVVEKHMDAETKEKFMGAKDTEINKFLMSEALERLPKHRQPSRDQAMSMRWLLSWKVDGDGQTVPTRKPGWSSSATRTPIMNTE